MIPALLIRQKLVWLAFYILCGTWLIVLVPFWDLKLLVYAGAAIVAIILSRVAFQKVDTEWLEVWSRRAIYMHMGSVVFAKIMPLDWLIAYRTIFVNDYYHDAENILRSAGFLAEPSIHGTLSIGLILIRLVLGRSLQFIPSVVVLVLVGSLSGLLILPIFLAAIAHRAPLRLSSSWARFGVVILAVLVYFAFTKCLLSLPFDIFDKSRFLWAFVAFNSLVFSCGTFDASASYYICASPDWSLDIASEFFGSRANHVSLPPSSGPFLLFSIGWLALIIFVASARELSRRFEGLQVVFACTYAVFVILFVQAPILCPLWMAIYASRTRPHCNNL